MYKPTYFKFPFISVKSSFQYESLSPLYITLLLTGAFEADLKEVYLGISSSITTPFRISGEPSLSKSVSKFTPSSVSAPLFSAKIVKFIFSPGST